MVADYTRRFMIWWITLVLHHRALAAAIMTLLTICAALYAAIFGGINSDLSTLIKPSADTAWYQQNETYKAAFPDQQQTAVVVISSPDVDSAADTASRLQRAFEASGTFSSVFAPQIDEFLTHHQALYLDDAQLDAWLQGVRFNFGSLMVLAEDASVSSLAIMLADQVQARHNLPLPQPIESLATSIVEHPDNVRLTAYPRLADPDLQRHYQLVILKAEQQHNSNLPNAAIVSRIRDIVVTTSLPDNVRVSLTGEVVLAHEEISAALQGVWLAGIVSLILLAVILGRGIGSLKSITSIFVMLLTGIIWTMAWATAIVGQYNTLSMIFVVMFFGLGVDFAVHFVLRVREAWRAGEDQRPYQQAVAAIGPALALCALTSGIAFLAFVPTAYRGLGELGLISAGGMVIALFLTITLVPLIGIDLRGQRREGVNLQPPRGSPVVVVGTLSALIVAAAYLARDIDFDYSVLAIRDSSTEGMQALIELQDAALTTDYSIYVLATDASAARALSEKLLALPEVASVSSPAALVPIAQTDKAARLQTALELFDEIETVAIEALEAESFLAALTYLEQSSGPDANKQALATALVNTLRSLDNEQLKQLNQRIVAEVRRELSALRSRLAAKPFTLEDLPESITRNLVTIDGRWLLIVQPAAALTSRDLTTQFVNAVSAVSPNIAGRSVVEWGVGTVVVESFKEAVAIAAVAIVILLHVYFRSLLLPWLVLLPIALAMLFTAAVCELTGLTINMANILVVPLIIGLGVDTGIHVVDRYRHSDSLQQALASSTTRAAIISALTTIGTFVSLSFSPHKGAASVGLLLAIAITLMLLCTLLILPALLNLTSQRSRQAT